MAVNSSPDLTLRVWIAMRPTENDSTRLYRNDDISAVVIRCSYSSNLVDRKSKCYFIIKFSLLLSIRLCWSKYAGKTAKIEFVASFL